MDTSVGEKTRIIRGEDCYTRTEFISGAGHHVYANNSEAFNEEVEKIFSKVEKGEDLHGCPPGLNFRFKFVCVTTIVLCYVANECIIISMTMEFLFMYNYYYYKYACTSTIIIF